MFLMQLFGALMFGFVNHQAGIYGQAGNYGDTAIAVWGGIYALFMVANMPVYGINQGTQPIVGFNYGAKRFDRVKQALLTGILYSSTLTVLGFVVAMLIPGPVMELFINAKTPNRPELISLGVHAMRLCFLLSPLVGFQVVSASYFQATGKPREATLLMLSRQVFLLIPLVWILPKFFQLDGVWMALPISDGVSSLVTGACLLFELRHLDSRHQEMTVEKSAAAVAGRGESDGAGRRDLRDRLRPPQNNSKASWPSSVKWFRIAWNRTPRRAGEHSRSDRCSRCDLRDATRACRETRSANMSILALEPAGASVRRNSAVSAGLKSSSWPHSKIASNTFRIEKNSQ